MPIAYENVKGLKRPNQNTQYTSEQVSEIMKCSRDIIYFAEKYFTVIEEVRGKHIIKLFDYQKETLKAFVENRYTVLCYSRQMGKSTCASIYLLWVAMFETDKTIGILANKEDSAKSLIKDIKLAYLEFPEWMKPGADKWDQLIVGFENGSYIMGGATSSDSFRGESLSIILLDEFAFIDNSVAEDFFTSVFPTISTGGRMIIVSTPNGAAGKFYDIFTNAGKSNPFKPLKVKWSQHPDRDENWKKQMMSIMSAQKFAQEHEVSFSGSSNTLINGDVITSLKDHVIDPQIIPEEGYYIYKPYMKGHLYAFGVDVAKGANSDYSVINIFDVTHFTITGKYEQVALFRRNNIVLFDFIDKLFLITKQWANPMLVVENNGLGDVICKQLYNEKEYENIFFDYEKAEHGINANVRTKPTALNFFKNDVENNNLLIRSDELVKELTYFEEVNPGIFKARNGKNFHDDVISSSYWISFALRSRYFSDDFMYYSGRAVVSTDNTATSQQDEEILSSFNRYIHPITYIDNFRRQISR